MRRRSGALALSLILATATMLRADASGGAQLAFHPDPLSVQRYGAAYRYPQAGWIVLHIEGDPYERGYQHGRLLAPEIVAYLNCSAALRSATAPTDAWTHTRSLVNALFLRRYDREYLEEMKGIADGASAVGGRFDHRPIDLVDIVALNAWPEIDTLEPALEATPTGLEGIRFPHQQPRPMPTPQEMHCSAFAATGPATADGKIVFGHITMFGLYPSLFYNVWLDVKPTNGHRVFMQTYPAGIQSGMDYYLNDAGLVVCETTIKQTRFNPDGMALASRIRQALQYADTIEQAADILLKANNGLYTNEWLLADTKSNEIAMLELGTNKSKLYRSSKNEWFGGTPGFYWGCNNTKDLDVRLDTYPGVNAEPANLVWRPSDRDKTWLSLYEHYKGRIDADFGKIAFTTPPVAACVSLDAKFTTTDLAKEGKTWALFGPPLGRSWQPTDEEKKKYPQVHAMASNPWTIFGPAAPPSVPLAAAPADIHEKVDFKAESSDEAEEMAGLVRVPAWHGTLLPRTDADTWLATAFADYERIVSLEQALRERAKDGRLSTLDRERVGLQLFAYRSSYLAGARAAGDTPLARTQSAIADDNWYRIAAGKGVLVLHELRRLIGEDRFATLMEEFGKEHAGKEVSTDQFIAAAEKAAGKSLQPFFSGWLNGTPIPRLYLENATVLANGNGYRVEGAIRVENAALCPEVDVTVETSGDDITRPVQITAARTTFRIDTDSKPRRVWVDKYGWTAKSNGGAFSVTSFMHDLPQTLIVYGTADEVASNREAAELLQRAILRAWSNYTVPIKADTEITGHDLQGHHVLLVGRPDSNHWIRRMSAALPVTFGSRSFRVGAQNYAHAGSGIVVAAENPLDSKYSVVVLAGLSADATLRLPTLLMARGQTAGEAMLVPNGEHPRHKVVPPADLLRELDGSVQARR